MASPHKTIWVWRHVWLSAALITTGLAAFGFGNVLVARLTGLDELRATPQDEQVWQDVVVVVAVYAVLAGWTVAGVPQRTVENASFVGAVLGGALYAALRVQARESG